MDSMKTIKLFGDLQAFKAEWSLNVQTVAEAMRAINANRPGFLQAADAGDYVLIMLDEDNTDLIRPVTMENALDPWGNETLLVVPRISGETGIEIGAAVAAAVGATGIAATAIAVAVNVVVAMALSVAVSMVASLLSNTNDGMRVDNSEPYESKPSYLFNGAVNTTRQGHRIPLLYGGPMLVGSMVLSADINVSDTAA